MTRFEPETSGVVKTDLPAEPQLLTVQYYSVLYHSFMYITGFQSFHCT